MIKNLMSKIRDRFSDDTLDQFESISDMILQGEKKEAAKKKEMQETPYTEDPVRARLFGPDSVRGPDPRY